MRVKGGKSHLRRKKPARTRGLFDETIEVQRPDRARLRKLMPYGLK
jgi:large subunit ribosomal protein L35